MEPHRAFLKTFFSDRSGAVTLDWVALTSGAVIIGIGLVYTVFGDSDGSVSSLISGFTTELGVAATNLSGTTASPPPPLQ